MTNIDSIVERLLSTVNGCEDAEMACLLVDALATIFALEAERDKAEMASFSPLDVYSANRILMGDAG